MELGAYVKYKESGDWSVRVFEWLPVILICLLTYNSTQLLYRITLYVIARMSPYFVLTKKRVTTRKFTRHVVKDMPAGLVAIDLVNNILAGGPVTLQCDAEAGDIGMDMRFDNVHRLDVQWMVCIYFVLSACVTGCITVLLGVGFDWIVAIYLWWAYLVDLKLEYDKGFDVEGYVNDESIQYGVYYTDTRSGKFMCSKKTLELIKNM